MRCLAATTTMLVALSLACGPSTPASTSNLAEETASKESEVETASKQGNESEVESKQGNDSEVETASKESEVATKAFDIRPHAKSISHTHGGKPASIGSVEFTLTNPSATPVTLRVKKLRWLTGVGPAKERRIESITLEGQAAPRTISILPGTVVRLRVRFEPVGAYFTAHEQFATEVDFVVDDKPMTVESPMHVIRRTPLNR